MVIFTSVTHLQLSSNNTIMNKIQRLQISILQIAWPVIPNYLQLISTSVEQVYQSSYKRHFCPFISKE